MLLDAAGVAIDISATGVEVVVTKNKKITQLFQITSNLERSYRVINELQLYIGLVEEQSIS